MHCRSWQTFQHTDWPDYVNTMIAEFQLRRLITELAPKEFTLAQLILYGVRIIGIPPMLKDTLQCNESVNRYVGFFLFQILISPQLSEYVQFGGWFCGYLEAPKLTTNGMIWISCSPLMRADGSFGPRKDCGHQLFWSVLTDIRSSKCLYKISLYFYFNLK